MAVAVRQPLGWNNPLLCFAVIVVKYVILQVSFTILNVTFDLIHGITSPVSNIPIAQVLDVHQSDTGALLMI
jgi:hypothetical protein